MRTRPLTDLAARELRPLLDEEAGHWSRELLWDFEDVTSAVLGGIERRSLAGRVIHDGARPVAYGYYMMDSARAVVGSLFASAGARGRGLEEGLLDSMLGEAQGLAGSERVECQTLFSTASGADFRFARAGFTGRRRHYLVRDLGEPLPSGPSAFRLRPFRREDVAAAAAIIHRSHVRSLDAALNLTYSSPATCRAFVETLVLRSGCGRFDSSASLVADGGSGCLGVILASRLSRANGHVCQVSVVPEAQGRGLGTQLVLSALGAMADSGLHSASLSVTVENHRAYDLYVRLGFRLKKEFAAHAWVRPPARIEIPA
ncbi:MAG TPA: GNAT family N-acetyltransferase [Vicinamibacteria bacterium]|nr:GNAT family N-acetyltransferase [Vicinamibacteria bacterium]